MILAWKASSHLHFLVEPTRYRSIKFFLSWIHSKWGFFVLLPCICQASFFKFFKLLLSSCFTSDFLNRWSFYAILIWGKEMESFDFIHAEIEKRVSSSKVPIYGFLMCAILVASVGLNMNSTAVIIGAMLISPLMGPINGMGYGIATYWYAVVQAGHQKLYFCRWSQLDHVGPLFFYNSREYRPFRTAGSYEPNHLWCPDCLFWRLGGYLSH